ncbi:glycosyltransferase family protein [Flavobacterium ustbae]|uniref:hypothetical protein n=1 Tax=Flavobacterium ustbae TaxID=2488790 RepID=UPI000F77967C|nr:hypothetical protein [Flavobacterium ustbae]
MEKPRILYIMHVPWGWIKQRPHFFAEYLNKDFDLNVVYKKPLKVSKSNLINEKNNGMSISSFFIFPFQRIPVLKHLKFLIKINDILIRMQLPSLKRYDSVWVTSWAMYNLIYKILPSNVRLIYDCMDDELEFADVKNNPVIFKEAMHMEKNIMQRADIVFCSSEYLKNKVLKRTGINRNVIVVNNAIGIPNHSTEIKRKDIFDAISSINNSFMYVGAISSWFDFESILHVLKKNGEVSFLLLGPSDVQIPKHDRLHYFGTVDRADMFKLMENVSGLIMPFKLNELIRSVNPVKIYEYIYMSKPVIATRYSESELFTEYIYLYNGKEELYNCINQIINNKLTVKKTDSENKEFALNNTWEVRYNLIKDSMT